MSTIARARDLYSDSLFEYQNLSAMLASQLYPCVQHIAGTKKMTLDAQF